MHGRAVMPVVVPAPGAFPTLVQLCSFLEESRVARQKFPERLELVSELPKTPSGKVRRNHLRALWTKGELAVIASG